MLIVADLTFILLSVILNQKADTYQLYVILYYCIKFYR